MVTVMVPNMQRSTKTSFVYLNCSFRRAKENRNVNRLDELLMIEFDCRKRRRTKTRT